MVLLQEAVMDIYGMEVVRKPFPRFQYLGVGDLEPAALFLLRDCNNGFFNVNNKSILA